MYLCILYSLICSLMAPPGWHKTKGKGVFATLVVLHIFIYICLFVNLMYLFLPVFLNRFLISRLGFRCEWPFIIIIIIIIIIV